MTAPRLGDDTDTVPTVADARPADPATQSRVGPGGHPHKSRTSPRRST